MPTGYTHKLYEGTPQTFTQFVLSCSRAMGALILMRDDPQDAPIAPVVEPSTYEKDYLEKRQAEYRRLQALSSVEAEREYEEYYQAECERVIERNTKAEEMRKRYEDMLAQVRAWTPPTDQHKGLKTFMVDQLTESIEFDCHIASMPAKEAWDVWHANRLEREYKAVGQAAQRWAEEVERAAGRTLWISKLFESLGLPTDAPVSPVA